MLLHPTSNFVNISTSCALSILQNNKHETQANILLLNVAQPSVGVFLNLSLSHVFPILLFKQLKLIHLSVIGPMVLVLKELPL